MRFPLCVLAVLSPALCWGQIAGDWSGVWVVDPVHSHPIVLHLTGPDKALQATTDLPDQGRFNVPAISVAFFGSTLEFSPASNFQYSGLLNNSDTIAGTFYQSGVGYPLVFKRTATVAPSTGLFGFVQNGRYHDIASAVEFDLPSGWYLTRTEPELYSANGVRVFADRSGKARVITANMVKREIDVGDVSKALAQAIPHQLAMRAGQNNPGPLHVEAGYQIREGSIDETFINGRQTIRAIGQFQRDGKHFAELLAWIYTEHTRTYFMVRALADDLADVQAPFDQMLQSAKIP
jgi:hypothetical protein